MHSKTNLVSFKSTTTTYWLFPLLSQESLEKLVELFNCTKMLEEDRRGEGFLILLFCFWRVSTHLFSTTVALNVTHPLPAGGAVHKTWISALATDEV